MFTKFPEDDSHDISAKVVGLKTNLPLSFRAAINFISFPYCARVENGEFKASNGAETWPLSLFLWNCKVLAYETIKDS